MERDTETNREAIVYLYVRRPGSEAEGKRKGNASVIL